MALPPQLKSLQHHLRTAQEHEKRDPVVAYYCRLYAMQTGMKLDSKTPECRKFLIKLMDQLETVCSLTPFSPLLSSPLLSSPLYVLSVVMWDTNVLRVRTDSRRRLVLPLTRAALLVWRMWRGPRPRPRLGRRPRPRPCLGRRPRPRPRLGRGPRSCPCLGRRPRPRPRLGRRPRPRPCCGRGRVRACALC
uniref:Vta1/callose synthase N-terminal domain-containing protein n=1 Tax=Labrus bergylta TaxID=56723 RepID=A0A3Q3FED1_9LABR